MQLFRIFFSFFLKKHAFCGNPNCNSYSIYASVRSEFCQILRTKCNFSALSMQNLTSFAFFLSKYLHMSKFYSNFATNFEEKTHGIY